MTAADVPSAPAVQPQPDAVVRAARAGVLASLLGLIALGLAWELWLAPTGSGTLAIKVLPLVLGLPGAAAPPHVHLPLAEPAGLAVFRRGRGARDHRGGRGARAGRGRDRCCACCCSRPPPSTSAAACAARRRRPPEAVRRDAVDLLDALRQAVGAAQVLTEGDLSAWELDWRKRWRGRALAVVRPGSTAEVAAVVRACAARRRRHRAAGRQHRPRRRRRARRQRHAGAAEPAAHEPRARHRRAPTSRSPPTPAACCRRCRRPPQAHGLLFPLSLAAEGSCTIGGNLATNAGGTQVLRWGNARELCLGLEVVTAAGRGLGRPERPAQGQHRLRPARPVHRQRRHAGHHHRGDAEARAAARGHHSRRWPPATTWRSAWRCWRWRARGWAPG